MNEFKTCKFKREGLESVPTSSMFKMLPVLLGVFQSLDKNNKSVKRGAFLHRFPYGAPEQRKSIQDFISSPMNVKVQEAVTKDLVWVSKVDIDSEVPCVYFRGKYPPSAQTLALNLLLNSVVGDCAFSLGLKKGLNIDGKKSDKYSIISAPVSENGEVSEMSIVRAIAQEWDFNKDSFNHRAIYIKEAQRLMIWGNTIDDCDKRCLQILKS